MVVSTVASQHEGPGLKSTSWVVCVALVFSPCACMGSLQALWLPPTFMDVRLIGVFELAVGMSAA